MFDICQSATYPDLKAAMAAKVIHRKLGGGFRAFEDGDILTE